MIGPDDIDDMRPESPMPPPERSAEWLAGWRAAQEANARALEQVRGGSFWAAIIRAMRPEGEG